MTDRMIDKSGLMVAPLFADFIEMRALPGTGIDPHAFWAGTADILARFSPENVALLRKRDTLQAQIDIRPLHAFYHQEVHSRMP